MQREKDVYFYSGKDPVTGFKWIGGINFDKRGKVLNSFSEYRYNKKSGNENVLIAAEHAGKNGYFKYLKVGNSKKHEKRLIDAIGPNKVWDSDDTPYLAFALDQLPGLKASPTSTAVSIGGSDFSYASRPERGAGAFSFVQVPEPLLLSQPFLNGLHILI
ncbi:hypothetical protein [Synechococcus sp. RS9902]|uniref:hypothetical protein n=1 Tax=Synechococcus sp. RS9902 TaxID=221345 RepID=UPI001646420A|nr:hypothetical protein [Synechococcus sp. RS9902]